MIAIFSALDEEVKSLTKHFSVQKAFEYEKCTVYEGTFTGKETLLVITGMGKEHAERSTLAVMSKHLPTAVISTGFGGSLNDKTKVGDAVVYRTLASAENHNGRELVHSDPALIAIAVKAAEKTGVRLLTGKASPP
jgi:nucleoside phosphorylase